MKIHKSVDVRFILFPDANMICLGNLLSEEYKFVRSKWKYELQVDTFDHASCKNKVSCLSRYVTCRVTIYQNVGKEKKNRDFSP